VTALTSAVRAGYKDLGQLLNDPDLDSLRNDPGFLALVDTLSSKAAAR
jgi:hypothetical protein